MAKSKTMTAGLPKWNLSDLYTSPKSRKLKTDLLWTKNQSEKFRMAYKGKLKSLDGQGLGRAIMRYETIVERTGKIISYGQLLHATFMSDSGVSAFFQNLQEELSSVAFSPCVRQQEENSSDAWTLSTAKPSPNKFLRNCAVIWLAVKTGDHPALPSSAWERTPHPYPM